MVDEKGTPITIGHLTTAINQIEQWSRIVRLALVEIGEDTSIELSPKISDLFVRIGPPKVLANCDPSDFVGRSGTATRGVEQARVDSTDLPAPRSTPGTDPDH